MPRASDLDTPLLVYKLLIGLILGGFSCWMLHTFVQPQETGLERMLSIALINFFTSGIGFTFGTDVAIVNFLAMLAFLFVIFAYRLS